MWKRLQVVRLFMIPTTACPPLDDCIKRKWENLRRKGTGTVRGRATGVHPRGFPANCTKIFEVHENLCGAQTSQLGR